MVLFLLSSLIISIVFLFDIKFNNSKIVLPIAKSLF